MARKPREQTRKSPSAWRGGRRRPMINEEEEAILKKAQIYLLFEAGRPHLWTVADIREEKGEDGSRRWIIAVNLRYPTGFRGISGRPHVRRDPDHGTDGPGTDAGTIATDRGGPRRETPVG